MTSPVIPPMGSSGAVSRAGGGGNERIPGRYPGFLLYSQPGEELPCYAPSNLHLKKAITVAHDTF